MKLKKCTTLLFALLFILMVHFIAGLAQAGAIATDFFSSLPQNSTILLTLANGDSLLGKFQSFDAATQTVTLENETLGTLHLDAQKIADAKLFNADTQVLTKIEIQEKHPKQKIWESQISGGLNGTSGNSKNLSIRGGAKTKRQTDRNKATLEGNYVLGYSKDSTTGQNKKNTHRFTADGRSEWPIAPLPRLNVFLASSFEWDEFKDYDARWAISSGLGYDIIKQTNLLLATHLGAGVSREFGGTQDRWTPEGVAGVNLEYSPYDLAKFSAASEIFPNLNDLGEFRSVSKAGWTLFFTKAKTFNTGLGVEHRYDSTPGVGRKSSDWDYFATLTWLF